MRQKVISCSMAVLLVCSLTVATATPVEAGSHLRPADDPAPPTVTKGAEGELRFFANQDVEKAVGNNSTKQPNNVWQLDVPSREYRNHTSYRALLRADQHLYEHEQAYRAGEIADSYRENLYEPVPVAMDETDWKPVSDVDVSKQVIQGASLATVNESKSTSTNGTEAHVRINNRTGLRSVRNAEIGVEEGTNGSSYNITNPSVAEVYVGDSIRYRTYNREVISETFYEGSQTDTSIVPYVNGNSYAPVYTSTVPAYFYSRHYNPDKTVVSQHYAQIARITEGAIYQGEYLVNPAAVTTSVMKDHRHKAPDTWNDNEQCSYSCNCGGEDGCDTCYGTTYYEEKWQVTDWNETTKVKHNGSTYDAINSTEEANPETDGGDGFFDIGFDIIGGGGDEDDEDDDDGLFGFVPFENTTTANKTTPTFSQTAIGDYGCSDGNPYTPCEDETDSKYYDVDVNNPGYNVSGVDSRGVFYIGGGMSEGEVTAYSKVNVILNHDYRKWSTCPDVAEIDGSRTQVTTSTVNNPVPVNPVNGDGINATVYVGDVSDGEKKIVFEMKGNQNPSKNLIEQFSLVANDEDGVQNNIVLRTPWYTTSRSLYGKTYDMEYQNVESTDVGYKTTSDRRPVFRDYIEGGAYKLDSTYDGYMLTNREKNKVAHTMEDIDKGSKVTNSNTNVTLYETFVGTLTSTTGGSAMNDPYAEFTTIFGLEKGANVEVRNVNMSSIELNATGGNSSKINGKLVDEQGNGIPERKLYVQGGKKDTVTTDATGEFSIRENGSYQVTVGFPGDSILDDNPGPNSGDPQWYDSSKNTAFFAANLASNVGMPFQYFATMVNNIFIFSEWILLAGFITWWTKLRDQTQRA